MNKANDILLQTLVLLCVELKHACLDGVVNVNHQLHDGRVHFLMINDMCGLDIQDDVANEFKAYHKQTLWFI